MEIRTLYLVVGIVYLVREGQAPHGAVVEVSFPLFDPVRSRAPECSFG